MFRVAPRPGWIASALATPTITTNFVYSISTNNAGWASLDAGLAFSTSPDFFNSGLRFTNGVTTNTFGYWIPHRDAITTQIVSRILYQWEWQTNNNPGFSFFTALYGVTNNGVASARFKNSDSLGIATTNLPVATCPGLISITNNVHVSHQVSSAYFWITASVGPETNGWRYILYPIQVEMYP